MAGIKFDAGSPFKGRPRKPTPRCLGNHTMLQADSTGPGRPLGRPPAGCGLLMVWTSVRSPNFPDVPTLKELGYPMVYDLAVRHRRPEGDGIRRSSPNCMDAFKKANRGSGGDRDARQIRHGSRTTKSYRGLQRSSSVEITESERKGDRYARHGEEDELENSERPAGFTFTSLCMGGKAHPGGAGCRSNMRPLEEPRGTRADERPNQSGRADLTIPNCGAA